MSIACLIAIGSLYYNQPLLVLINQTFQVSVVQVSAVPTLTQMGYALGMLLFIPLGDRSNRRLLIVILSVLNAIALLLIAFSPNFQWLVAMSFINGMTAVAPQLLVPFAAQLARPTERGKVVGTVMCGLLGGIVVGRLLSGFVGAWLGWRSIFWMAALVMVGLAIVLARSLPNISTSVQLPYRALMRSLAGLLKTFPLLRETSLMGALFFSVYCGFWTTLPFLLAQPSFNFGSQVAGTFGLVGLVGVMAAPIVGRLADRRSPRSTVMMAMVILALALLTLWAFQQVLIGILIGAILLDLGIQTGQISNQTRIYTLPVEAHNRITTVYMVSYFLGGSVGSWLCAYGWKLAGWTGVCSIGLIAVAIAAIVFWVNRK
jgi:predicted MFS family arabinose efflux permease